MYYKKYFFGYENLETYFKIYFFPPKHPRRFPPSYLYKQTNLPLIMKYTKIRKILKSEKRAMEYLIKQGIIKETIKCAKCRCQVLLNIKKRVYRCTKVGCRKQKALFESTKFERTKKKMHKLLLIMWLYLLKTPVTGILMATGHSTRTVCRWTKRIRLIVSETICSEFVKIGGLGIIVEIDETKLGKRKYHRGHRVDGVWCIVGVERTSKKRLFAVNVDKRDAKTIEEIILKYVEPGSIIYTDGWKAYKTVCEKLGFEHMTVNHSKNFKDPVTGVHTNTVEGNNNGLKLAVPHRNRNKKDIKSYLHFYVWKRQNKKKYWKAFLVALKEHFNKK